MLKHCVTFGEPDLDSESCRACWKNMPEIFFSCIKIEYEQIRPQHQPFQGSTIEIF